MTFGDEAFGHLELKYMAWSIDFQRKVNQNADKGYWETKDNRRINFDSMGSSHSINIIKWCKVMGIVPPKQIFSYSILYAVAICEGYAVAVSKICPAPRVWLHPLAINFIILTPLYYLFGNQALIVKRNLLSLKSNLQERQ